MSRRSIAALAEQRQSSIHLPEPPVRKLALGILLQAFRDIVTPRESSGEDWKSWQDDAVEWFEAEDRDPGSLHWVCEILRVNPYGFRTWLRDYQCCDESKRREWARRLVRFHIPH